MKDLSLYIHIPFCIRKCAYCDFLSFPGGEEQISAYVKKLEWEIGEKAERYRGRRIKSIFIGGGTPSILSGEAVAGLLDVIQREYPVSGDAEISIEMNPATADEEKLRDFRGVGINRLSIGCQSLNDDELKLLGRVHVAEDFYRSFGMARAAGFDNINVDLMSGLPGQKVNDHLYNIDKLIKLGPEHVSVYSLIIEEGTEFYGRYGRAARDREKGNYQALLPTEEEERACIHEGEKRLQDAGYEQYEISNYAHKGYECRHNMVYWERGDYACFGLGASACVNDVRTKNTPLLRSYMEAGSIEELTAEEIALSHDDICSEAMFLGLRLNRGIRISDYEKRYGLKPAELYGEWIWKMCAQGLLRADEESIRLSSRGRDLANYVMAGFV